MEVTLQTLNNQGKSEVKIQEETNNEFVTLKFSDNPEQEYSIHLESLHSAIKAFRNIKKIAR